MKIPIDPISLVPVISKLVKIWVKTLRVEIHGDYQSLFDSQDEGQMLIISLWHGELFPIATCFGKYGKRFCVVISQSKDGELITRFVETYDIKAVRGSSSRGGVRALLACKRLMEKENRIGVFTVDGPRGPRHKVKDGIIFLAQRANAKIIPVRAYAKSKKVFNSWDRFMMPLPFSRCRFYIGEAMEVTSEKLDDDVMAREKARLEERMLSLGEDYN